MLKIIRPWQPADRGAVLALNCELQEHERALRPSRRPGPEMTEGYVRGIERQLAIKGDDAALLVAEGLDGSVLGFVTCIVDESDLEQDARELRIEDVVVAGRVRRQGIGRALLEAACGFARARGVQRVEITVVSGNVEAAAAYASMGFVPARVTLERLPSEPA